jgi:hypothetical protein
MNRVLVIAVSFFLATCQGGGSSSALNSTENNDVSGIYKANKGSEAVYFKLTNVRDSLYYFELFDSAQYADLGTRKAFGTVVVNHDTLRQVLTSTPMNSFIAIYKSPKTLVIDSGYFRMPDVYAGIKGTYNKIETNSVFHLGIDLTAMRQWDELQSIKEEIIQLRPYPSVLSDPQSVQIYKGEWIKSFAAVNDNVLKEFQYYYIEIRGNGNNTVRYRGWIDNVAYYEYLKRIYKCTINEKGVVEKWNKEGKYTLYFDTISAPPRRVDD